MALACQKNCYLKELTTKAVSCETATLVITKKKKISGFEVILEDTVLFPESGGQPDDRGTLNDTEVLRVTRRGGNGVHFVLTPIDVGSEVEVKVDWKRRFDHMQQHSGQHLVTAVADAMYGFKTMSWNLGETESFIELNTSNITQDQIDNIERVVNEKIRDAVPMYPTLYDSIDDPKLKEARTRGLPDDHVGPVRVVTIEGMENNMCCGTHVSNLSHLQAVKLLVCEKGKGKCYLIFLVGDRVLNYAQKCYNNNKALTERLKTGPDNFAELIDKLQKTSKSTQKNAVTLLRDLAVLEAEKFKQKKSPDNHLLCLHRKEGDVEFMNILVNEVNDQTVTLFLTVGDEKTTGMFMFAADEATITKFGPKIAELLEGKGFSRYGRYQGKANKMANRSKVENILRGHFIG